MESKSKFNFSQYTLSKPSAGHWIRNVIYFVVIIILISLIYWLLTKRVKKIPPKSNKIEYIEHVKIEIDTTEQ